MKFSKTWLFLILVAVFEAYGFRGGLVYAGSVNIILTGLVYAGLAFIAIMIVWSIIGWERSRAREKSEKSNTQVSKSTSRQS
jgi:membrane protein implicated in regulation of membrane protease activity